MAEPHAKETEVVETPDGTVKITRPKGPRRHGVTVLLGSDDLVREQVGGFVSFLRKHAVVGLAIGFIIGLQAQTLVKQLVDSFITPLLTLIVGPDLQSRQLTVHGANPVTFAWGRFVYVLVDFMFVLFFIYLIVKLFNLDKLESTKKGKK